MSCKLWVLWGTNGAHLLAIFEGFWLAKVRVAVIEDSVDLREGNPVSRCQQRSEESSALLIEDEAGQWFEIKLFQSLPLVKPLDREAFPLQSTHQDVHIIVTRPPVASISPNSPPHAHHTRNCDEG